MYNDQDLSKQWIGLLVESHGNSKDSIFYDKNFV